MKRLISLLLLFFFCAPPLLFAQDSYSEFERGLELTRPQRNQMQGIRNQYINEWQSVRRESMRKRLELRELSRNPSANPERIGRLQSEVRELETTRGNIYNQYRWEVSRTLNERQRERYNHFVDTENKRMRGTNQGHQRRHGR
jgi:Spy/CpxP family protein refolding chaperone